jgi:hypothetical protein
VKELKAFVDQENRFSAIFGQKPLDLDSAADRQRIADKIDCQLSPENLSCDGELPMSQVRARYTKLTAAATDLVKLDPSTAQYMYEFG